MKDNEAKSLPELIEELIESAEALQETIRSVQYANYIQNRKQFPYIDYRFWKTVWGEKVEEFERLYQMEGKK